MTNVLNALVFGTFLSFLQASYKEVGVALAKKCIQLLCASDLGLGFLELHAGNGVNETLSAGNTDFCVD